VNAGRTVNAVSQVFISPFLCNREDLYRKLILLTLGNLKLSNSFLIFLISVHKYVAVVTGLVS